MKTIRGQFALLWQRPALTAAVLCALVLAVVQSARAAVTLIYFLADGLDGKVVLEWETATEIDNAGFYINRSLQETSGFARISPFIPAEGDSLTGATYVYTDTNVTNGTTYWYKLESIDFGQNSEFYEPPASVIAGGDDFPTVTPTSTPTGTITPPTSTSTLPATPTPTTTYTPQPTSTNAGAYPGPATSTSVTRPATQTPINTAAGTQGVIATTPAPPSSATPAISPTLTPTFIPVPEIVMQFPAAPGANSLRAAPASKNGSQVSSDPPDPWRSPGRFLFIGFIVLIWALLGGWFYFSMRKIE